MKTKLKQSVKKVLSFMLAVAMVITSFTLPSMTVKAAANTMNVTLHFDNTGKKYDAPAVQYWGGTSTTVTNAGEQKEIAGWDAQGWTMAQEGTSTSWKITLNGDLTGFQILDMNKPDGNNVIKPSDDTILALQQYAEETATDIYVLDKGDGYKFYSDAAGANEIQPPASAISSTDLTVHFKNERSWDTTYAMLAEGGSWSPIKGIEFCKQTSFGGIIQDDEKNAGWKTFKVTKDGDKDVNGNFNAGEWGDEKQTANFNIKITAETMEVWITFKDSSVTSGDDAKAIVVSDQKPEGWVDGGSVPEILDPDAGDTGVDNPEATKMKVYYYITDGKNAADYGVDVWGGAIPTEAGPKMTVTAWQNKKLPSLKETEKENTIDGLNGKWAYVGFDSNSIDGIQFATADGGSKVWISTIKTLGYKEVYYVPGYGWFTDEKANGDPIPAPVFHDNLYIVGAGDALGNWTLGNAVAMTKTEDTYSVTIPMKTGTYEFTPVHDPATFAWTYQYKDAANGYKNYTVTLEDDRDVTFIITNVDTAKVTADVAALKNYKVTFKNGDTVLSAQTVLEGQAAKAPETPKKTGYTFDGWDASFDEVTADLTVNAKWKANAVKPVSKTYKVVFKDGKKVVSTQTITSGKAATAPKLTKKGYTLSWDKSFNKVTADLTVNAKWTANKYTVSYNVNGGKKLKTTSKSVTYGKTYGKLAAPQRAGYTFAGWYTAKTKGTKITAGSKVAITKKTTLYARWSKVTNPGKVAKPSLKNSSAKAMKVSYKKVKGAAGYEIRYSTKSNMKSAKKVTTKSTSTTIKKLTKGKKYYVQVRAYKLDSAGKKIYSKAKSAKANITIKK